MNHSREQHGNNFPKKYQLNHTCMFTDNGIVNIVIISQNASVIRCSFSYLGIFVFSFFLFNYIKYPNRKLMQL